MKKGKLSNEKNNSKLNKKVTTVNGFNDKSELSLSENSNNSSKSDSQTFLKLHHDFIARSSYLDSLGDESSLINSPFLGFYRLFKYFIVLYMICSPTYSYIKFGYFVKPTLMNRIVKDLEILLIVYPLFYIWSYLAYFLQILIKNNIVTSNTTILILQHSSQTGVFIMTTLFCLHSNMCVTHMTFTVVQCMIHFFKMHSYTLVNRDYREKYFKNKKDGSSKLLNNDYSDYPNNITFWNYNYFLRAPTFIYRAEYPRTEKVRIDYFLQKSFLAIAVLISLYQVYTDYIEPIVYMIPTTSLIELVYLLYIPLFILCFLMFFLIFECILNAYAELARFADRQFYKDWWNSTDFAEFNRKWNKIVHEFLYQHIYLELKERYQWSEFYSKLMTIAFSAALHEFAICIVLRLIYPFMFVLMIAQIPVIFFTRAYLKNTKFGNYFFWSMTILGVCLIFIVYNKASIDIYGLTENN